MRDAPSSAYKAGEAAEDAAFGTRTRRSALSAAAASRDGGCEGLWHRLGMLVSTAVALQSLLEEATATLAKSAPRDAQGAAIRRLGRAAIR